MQALVSEISQMAVPGMLWEMPHMAKDDAPPGISAQLDRLLVEARPADLSERQWCIQSRVSTSFFTDLRNGREPGIDRVERLANRAGLRLSELVSRGDKIEAGRLAVPLAMPSAPRLAEAMHGLFQLVGMHSVSDELVNELAELLPDALENAGAHLVPQGSASAAKRKPRPAPPSKAGRGQQ